MRIWPRMAACVYLLVGFAVLLSGCSGADQKQTEPTQQTTTVPQNASAAESETVVNHRDSANQAVNQATATSTKPEAPAPTPVASASLPTASISSPAVPDPATKVAEKTSDPTGQASDSSTPPVAEPGSAEQLVRQITTLRLQPFAETDDVELQKQARRKRNHEIIKLAEQAIAVSFKDEAKRRIFEVAVHHLMEAQLQLALQGDAKCIEELYANAELLNQRFPQSKAAADAAYTVAKFAHSNAQRFASHEPRWLTEFANQAQLFAQHFPQESGRAVPLLFAAGQSCDLHGKIDEALNCFVALQKGFSENPRATQVVPSIRRLSLKGRELKLTGPTIDGGAASIDDYRGNVVLVVFWATHAQPFIDQLPDLLATIAKYRQNGLQVVGVNLDQEEPAVDAFLESHPIDWPQIFYPDRNRRGWNHPLAEMYGIRNLPMLWLVGRDAVVLETHLDPQTLATRLNTAFAAKQTPPADPVKTPLPDQNGI